MGRQSGCWIAGGLLAIVVGTTAPGIAGADMIVASRGSDRVLRFDPTGAPAGGFEPSPDLLRPVGVTFGPDGNVYVASGDTPNVVRFAPDGRYLGVFARGGAIVSPRNVNFGPDGAFYVADGMLSQILRFDGATGEFDRVWVEDPALNGPTSFTFGPDGHLYVVSVLTNQVLRFDGATGAYLGVFVTGPLSLPHDVSFGPDGNLYVTNSRTGLVGRFRGDTGEFIDTFVSDRALQQPLGMEWGTDGLLYVANQGGNEVRRYDGVTGALVDAIVAAGAGGLSAPSFLAFTPAASLSLAATADTGRAVVRLVASGLRPGARAILVHGTAGGSGEVPDCPGVRVGVGDPSVGAVRIGDESGNVVVDLASAAPGSVQAFVAIDASACTASEPVDVVLP